MAESPPRGGGSNADDGAGEAEAKTGESDPLFNPPGLKTRRTVMGLAPAPHLGGASRGISEAEERKQRVLARIAALDATKGETGPPPPLDYDASPRRYTGPPPPNPSASNRPPRDVEQTYMSPPPKFGTSTVLIHPAPGAPRTISSDARVPSASGWDVHERSQPGRPPVPEVATEVMEAAPITARMIRTTPVEVRTAGPMPVQATTLAVRPYEPSYSRSSLTGLTDKRLVLLSEPNSARASSYHLLRDNLLSKSLPRVLAVSSATPGDGKTTCAINLALSLAEMNSTRVLLIDGNFFEPELGEVFAIDRLSPITPPDGNAWLAPYKLVEVNAGLHLAAISRAPGEPAPRFDQHRFEGMIDRLVRVSYDYIIIDTPALRGSPAVTQLVAVADATLIAVRSGGTVGRDLRRAIDQIPEKKAFGLALIDAPPQE